MSPLHLAFGGGGGMHPVLGKVEDKEMVIPRLSGVFSAWGMLLIDLRIDYLQTQIV
jgi:N-methylhydantoinase A